MTHAFNSEQELFLSFSVAVSEFNSHVFFSSLSFGEARVKRLLAVAFIRDYLKNSSVNAEDVYYSLIDIAEKYADGQIDKFKMHGAAGRLIIPEEMAWLHPIPIHLCAGNCHIAFYSCSEFVIHRSTKSVESIIQSQAAIMFDAMGAYSWDFNSNWRTDTAVQLATGMYESKDFSPMPILADALQDAGCEQENLLSRMRDPQRRFYRGNWIVDQLLGKR